MQVLRKQTHTIFQVDQRRFYYLNIYFVFLIVGTTIESHVEISNNNYNNVKRVGMLEHARRTSTILMCRIFKVWYIFTAFPLRSIRF